MIIAEIGVNHNGSVGQALELIQLASESGADAVKFQCYQVDILEGNPQRCAMLSQLRLPNSCWGFLASEAHRHSLAFIVTPFDEPSLEFIAPYCDYIKIGSGELRHDKLLTQAASHRKPMIVSTGMSCMREIGRALEITGKQDVSLLHCVSAYPAQPKDCHLSAMEPMRKAFGVPVGWSDHTAGIAVPIAAAALGAQIIEVHLTKDTNQQGPDHAASLSPQRFRAMAGGVHDARCSIGESVKVCQPCEYKTLATSLRVANYARPA